MSNLIPERRLNKNGIAVTKHVRATAPDKTQRGSMPAPSLAKKAPAKQKLRASQLEDKYNVFLKSHYQTDADLLKAAPRDYKKPEMQASFVFTCSDAEVYDVVSTVGISNSGVLLNAGMRSKDEVTTFLNDSKLEHLERDSSDFTSEALKRGITPQSVFLMHRKYFFEDGDNFDQKRLLDAAEAQDNKSLREIKSDISIPQRVAEGEISMDDIKTIGATRFAKASEPNGYLLSQLISMQRGECKHEAQQIKDVISRFTNDKGSIDNIAVRMTLKISEKLGYDYASKVQNPKLAFSVALHMRGATDQQRGAVDYAELLNAKSKTSGILDSNKIAAMYKANVDADRAIQYLTDNTPIEQVIAIEQEGIAPSVSGGWL